MQNEDLENKLTSLEKRFYKLRERVRHILEHFFKIYSDQELPSLESKQVFAQKVNTYLRRFEFRIECPKCHQPSMLVAGLFGNAKNGLLQFSHGTHHGGYSKVPTHLKIIDAPQDRRFKKNK